MRREFESRIFHSASVQRKLLKMPRVEDPGAVLVNKFGQLMVPFQFPLKQLSFGFFWENVNDRDQEGHYPTNTDVGLVRTRKFKKTEQVFNRAQGPTICVPFSEQHFFQIAGLKQQVEWPVMYGFVNVALAYFNLSDRKMGATLQNPSAIWQTKFDTASTTP